jgi:hypothetical protein
VNFTLPANTFTDPNGQKLIYTATQPNGSALPSWLKFDSATGTFTGTPPDTPAAFDVKVTATNVSGFAASETFGVYALTGATVIVGTAGNDNISFAQASGNYIIDGGSGTYDVLSGGLGSNILISRGSGAVLSSLGSSGNNILDGGGQCQGGRGDDVYVVRPDTFAGLITDTAGGQDTVVFRNIDPEDLTVNWTSDGLDAVFRLNATGAELRIWRESPMFPSSCHIEQFVFEDGTVWDYSRLVEAVSTHLAQTGNTSGTDISQFGAGYPSGNDLQIDAFGANTRITVDDWVMENFGAAQEFATGDFEIDDQRSHFVPSTAHTLLSDSIALAYSIAC